MSDKVAGMKAVSAPRKIDLAEEMALAGVDVPQDISDAQPANAPVYLPYQQRWFEDQAQIMIAEKSRRTGLTWAEAGRNVINAAKPRRRGGCNTFYVGSKKEMALEYIAACALFARAFNQLAKADVYEQTFWDSDKQEEILTYMIRFPNTGRKIQALSSRPSNLRGLQGDVVIDEAAFHESLEELLKAALALTMWGNKVRLISTHNGVDNLFNELINDAREGRKDYSIHRITLDDAIADGLYQRICYVTGQTWSPAAEKKWRDDLYKNAPNKESADEEYGCVPKKSGGTYINRVLIEAAMVADHSIPIYRFDAPEDFMSWTTEMREAEVRDWCEANLKPALTQLSDNCRYAFGEDFARRGDLSVFVPLQIKPDLRKRVPFVVELRNTTYDQQKQIMFYICSRLPRLMGLAFDATGNGGYLAEAAALEYGTEMVDQVNLSQSWYHEWMPKLKGEFEAFNLELPRHQTVLDDVQHIKLVNGIPAIDKGRKDDVQSGKGKRHGDFAVGLCMAVRASYMEGGAIEYTPLPATTSRWDGHAQRDFNRPDDDDDFSYNTKGGCW
ncbi:hypothetical protein JYB87_12720 [Shewanella avicenniae]|uniref:Mu-like prophage FluMu protein gp28 n=1 Tax=Shewanella avicenniae TaxID=2814294 RepID=A0ABX7QMD6_9GAMM|nr:terminase family protein [Shewanella avicenniae]QSX32612.1 hypothetical protein JYB87_12720 [Shewanella avicenniae]